MKKSKGKTKQKLINTECAQHDNDVTNTDSAPGASPRRNSHESPSQVNTPSSLPVTPMPNTGEYLAGIQDIGAETDVHEEPSLTQLLTVTPSQSDNLTAESSQNSVFAGARKTDSIPNSDPVVPVLESELKVATDINASLLHQIQLLENEITDYQKRDRNQKSEIKKLTLANDKLRRDLSRHQGMRRFVAEPNEAANDTGTYVMMYMHR